MSEPVNVTNMDFGIPDVDWIVELLPQGIIQGKDPRPGLHVNTGTKAQRKISHKIIHQRLLVIPSVYKKEDTGIPLKEESGFKGTQAVKRGKYRVLIHPSECIDPTEPEQLIGKEVIVPDITCPAGQMECKSAAEGLKKTDVSSALKLG